MRLFIGIDLPAELKSALIELQSELKQRGVKGGWKSPQNFHITLEFLGEVGPNLVPTLSEILSKVASNHKSFALSIGGLGAFPSFKRPHTLWTALGESLKELHHLRDELHLELKNNGFKLEDRPFKPHITLASRPQVEHGDLSKFQQQTMGNFAVTEMILFESRVINGKRTYPDLFRAKLIKSDR